MNLTTIILTPTRVQPFPQNSTLLLADLSNQLVHSPLLQQCPILPIEGPWAREAKPRGVKRLGAGKGPQDRSRPPMLSNSVSDRYPRQLIPILLVSKDAYLRGTECQTKNTITTISEWGKITRCYTQVEVRKIAQVQRIRFQWGLRTIATKAACDCDQGRFR